MLSEPYIELMAIDSIRCYLNKREWSDSYVSTRFETAILLIKENYRVFVEATGGISNISSMTQGGQSIGFNSSLNNALITEEVKMILPKPYLKLF